MMQRILPPGAGRLRPLLNLPLLLLTLLLLGPGAAWGQLTGTKTVGGAGTPDYPTLTAAVAAVNSQGISGSVVLELQSGYVSASETFPISYTLVPTGTNTITIRPASGVNGLVITGSNSSGAIIQASGGKNLILDGRPGGSGASVSGAVNTTNDLTIANTNGGLSSSAVAFSNDATFNTVQHCQLRAATVGAAGGGVVVFGSTAPNVLGNSNNTIQYNDLRESSGGTPTVCVYSGATKNAANTIANNNIYNFFRNSAADCYGIYLSSAGNGWTISVNSLYQTVNRTGPGNANMYAVDVVSGNNHLISGNLIGGQSASCGSAGSPMTINGTVSSYKFVGMFLGSSATTGYSVQGNTIANIDWLSNSAGTTSNGGLFSCIYVAGGTMDIGGNATSGTGNSIGTPTLPIIVRPTTNSGGFVNGISTNGGGGVATVNIYRNTIQNITAIGATASVGGIVRGIYFQNLSGASATISGNRIANLASTIVSTNAAALCYGIDCQAPTSTITNNLIGDLRVPAANSSSNAVIGITLSTTSTASIYYNTVYLNASTPGATFGSSALSASTAVALDLRNNILVNTSTPGTTAGLTVALRRSAAVTTATYLDASNNNLLYGGAAAANKLLYSDGTVPGTIQTLTAYKNLLTTAAGRDLYSVTELPTFSYTTVMDAASQAGFLHFANGTVTQAESGAQPIANIPADVDGDTRASDFSDIGADEGSFSISDKTQPYIRFTPLANGPVATSRLLSAVIGDPSGVGLDNSSLTTAGPYIYYRKGTSGSYIQAAYTSVSGAGNTRTFGFTIDYTALGGVVTGDVIQYYLAAQDAAATPNGGTFVPNVGNILTGINSPGTTNAATYTGPPNQYTIVPTIPATVYVGTDPGGGATFYPSITKAGGLFAALNGGFLNQSVTALVNADLSGEDGTNALNAFVTDGNGTTNGSYTLTLQSDGTLHTVVGTGVATANIGGLIRFNGALNVTVSGGSGTARNLLFRTTTTTAVPVFSFYGDARFNTLNNLTVESNNVAGTFGTNPGTVAFYLGASATGGNRNNLLDNCDIRNRSDIAAAIATNPVVAIYSGGSSTTGTNSNNTVRSSNVFDFQGSGFYQSSTGGGDNWTIGGSATTGNNFYESATTTTALTPVNIGGGVSHTVTYNNFYQVAGAQSGGYVGIDVVAGNGVTLSNNNIGGSLASNGGSPLTNSSSSTFAGIRLSVGSGSGAAPYTLVQNNVIKNLAQTSAANGSVYGIYVLGGAVNVSSNTVGDANPTTPAVGFNSASTTVGMYFGSSASPCLINSNTVSGMQIVGASASNIVLSGIQALSGGHTIGGGGANTVGNLSNTTGSGSSPTLQGISISGSTAATIQGNTIKGLQLASGGGANGTLFGIATSSAGHQILNNTVGGLANADALVNASPNNSGTVLTAAIQSAGAYPTALIAGNLITNISNTGTANSSSSNINVVYGVSAVNTTGLLARNNRITNVFSTASANTLAAVSEGVQAMALRGAATNTSFQNNQISLVGNGLANIAVAGLSNATNNASATGNTFYFNSVYLSGTTGTGVKTYALYHQTTVPTAGLLKLRNNVLVNARTGGTGNFAIGVRSTLNGSTVNLGTDNTASVDLDYNDLYASESTARQAENGLTPYNFAAWQAQTNSPDAHSKNVNVKFVDSSIGNLNLDPMTNCQLDNTGVAIAGINGEYDNPATSRQTTPDLGSDEFSFTPPSAGFASTTPLCGAGSLSVTIGSGNGPFTINYSIGGVTQTPITNAASGTTISVPAQASTTTVVLTGVSDSFGCALGLTSGATSVTVRPNATASAGSNAAVCPGNGYTTTGSYGGSATSATYTSSGTGSFSNGGVIDSGTPSVQYVPSAADITAGSVTLTLTTSGPCAAATGTLTLTIAPVTTYTGAIGTDWFDARNWSSCLPSSTVSAIIPGGLTNYPLIASGAANVLNLTIASGGSLTQTGGTLSVYGNLSNSGTADLTGGLLALRGSAPTVTGLSALASLEVNLSSGTASLGSPLTVNLGLTMTQGLLSTSSYTLTLLFPSTLSETETSYLTGTVSVPDRSVTVGSSQSFGGIGLVLTPAALSTSPGLTPVVRTTGTALSGAGTSVSIQRYFDIQPAVNTGLNVAMDFSYFNHELNGIAPASLGLFKSVSGTSGPWANQNPISSAGNTISKASISDFSIWTLGDLGNPLPVELSAFGATREGRDALLAWTTASEKNSRGFEVQVSTDGRGYRMLGFVASPSASSTAARQYRFRDQETVKASLRYYRLRQLDFDGTATFSPVRTLRFDTEAASPVLAAAPNPFAARLTLAVTLATAQPARLTLTDMAGRTLRTLDLPALPAGLSQLELPEVARLAAGVYLVELALPGQPTQHLRVVKE